MNNIEEQILNNQLTIMKELQLSGSGLGFSRNINNTLELLNPDKEKEDCCDMSEKECVKDESHSEGCNCGFELEKGKEGCGDVIEELVDTDDNGEIIDTRWLHCGEDKELCDDCKKKNYALEEKSE